MKETVNFHLENEVQYIGKEWDKIDGIAYHPNKLTEYHVMIECQIEIIHFVYSIWQINKKERPKELLIITTLFA